MFRALVKQAKIRSTKIAIVFAEVYVDNGLFEEAYRVWPSGEVEKHGYHELTRHDMWVPYSEHEENFPRIRDEGLAALKRSH